MYAGRSSNSDEDDRSDDDRPVAGTDETDETGGWKHAPD